MKTLSLAVFALINNTSAIKVTSQSRPACNSYECQKGTAAAPLDDVYKFKDYSVPNFGVDNEIADSEKSMAEMEAKFPLNAAAI